MRASNSFPILKISLNLFKGLELNTIGASVREKTYESKILKICISTFLILYCSRP